MNDVGLVLEGGGMRGAYTAGVLDYFLDQGVHFPYVVGASAGACNGSSYVAKQRGRNYRVIVEYGDHPEYISYKRMLTKRQLFGMDFLFDKLPNELVPFDYESFMKQSAKFVVATTDMDSGRPVFFDSFHDRDSLLKVIRASSSLPMIAPSIEFKGFQLMDGGIADPIPLQRSIDDGNQKHVIVLTRNDGYIKGRSKAGWYLNRRYKKFPNFAKTMADRHIHYNAQLEHVRKMEEEGRAFVIRPRQPLVVSRIERNRDRLHNLYMQGYQEAEALGEQLTDFLQVDHAGLGRI
ncbi:patatin family protein [Halobacillus litoralis]|uniref:Patatin family protein n=1 Tax=Halobacillus litoralis TaxID=45668 RepID=A0A845DR21_9BACI|nr:MULTISPECIES: patatin family protein [Halobacillus]MCA1023466.1 patatin family protein [Halobacillus litoralis]MYL18995.1 patatin family protein [Halobacillus litoralis]MYL31063.1 patatin family protein [Halobacillus halophilus]MYL39372.1 patatin family protein [Halobacillus litoralis]